MAKVSFSTLKKIVKRKHKILENIAKDTNEINKSFDLCKNIKSLLNNIILSGYLIEEECEFIIGKDCTEQEVHLINYLRVLKRLNKIENVKDLTEYKDYLNEKEVSQERLSRSEKLVKEIFSKALACANNSHAYVLEHGLMEIYDFDGNRLTPNL